MRRCSCPVPATARRPWPARLTDAALAPARRYLSQQAGRPHGPVGLLLSQIWIRETAAVNDTAIELLAPSTGERILELGFGPGRTLGRIRLHQSDGINLPVDNHSIDGSSASTPSTSGPSPRRH